MNPLAGISQRLPPTNIQAEQALLGAILANNKAYEAVAHFLLPEHFADPINGRIYAVAAARIDAGGVADAVSLKAALENSGVLDEVGGAAYLPQLITAMVGIINAREYGQAVHDCWLRRELIDVGERLVNNAFGVDSLSGREVLAAAEEELYRLGAAGQTETASFPAHVAMARAIGLAEKARDTAGGLVGLTTGFRELDDITGGWKPASLNVIAARPSMGKTTLALGVAAGAVMAGASVLLCSCEMDAVAIGAQLTAGLADVARDAVERGKVRDRDALGRFVWMPASQREFDAMVAAMRRMVARNLEIDECPSRTVAAIRAAARRVKRRRGLDLIVIDYLGLLRVPELARFGNQTMEIERLSGDCKALAKDLGIPVVLLSQLNREVTKRENKRPLLSDLRQSGAIEQDADLVGFIHREEYYLRDAEPKREPRETDEAFANRQTRWGMELEAATGRAEIIIAKQRRGRVGAVQLAYDSTVTWFRDLEE